MWNLERNDTNELTKQKETHRLIEGIYGYWGGRGSQGAWEGHVHTSIFKMDNKQDLIMCSPWNSTHCYVTSWMGGGFGENGYMYGGKEPARQCRRL